MDELLNLWMFILVCIMALVWAVLVALSALVFTRNLEHLPLVTKEAKKILFTHHGVESFTYEQIYVYLRKAMLHSALPYVVSALRSGQIQLITSKTTLTYRDARRVATELAATIVSKMG